MLIFISVFQIRKQNKESWKIKFTQLWHVTDLQIDCVRHISSLFLLSSMSGIHCRLPNNKKPCKVKSIMKVILALCDIFFVSFFLNVSVFEVMCISKIFFLAAVILFCSVKESKNVSYVANVAQQWMKCITVSHVVPLSSLPWGKIKANLIVDLLLVCRDGCSHSDGCTNTEGSAEWTEWRRNTAGDGQVPFCISGKGFTLLLYHTVQNNVLIFLLPLMVSSQGLWP